MRSLPVDKPCPPRGEKTYFKRPPHCFEAFQHMEGSFPNCFFAFGFVFSLRGGGESPSAKGFFALPGRGCFAEWACGPAIFKGKNFFCGGCFYFFPLRGGSVASGEGFFSLSARGGFASRRVTFFVWTKKVTKKSHSPRALRGSSSVAS